MLIIVCLSAVTSPVRREERKHKYTVTFYITTLWIYQLSHNKTLNDWHIFFRKDIKSTGEENKTCI